MVNINCFLGLLFNLIAFLSYSTLVIAFCSILMYRRLNRYLALQYHKLVYKKFRSQMQLALKLNVFRREHHRITSMVAFSNRTVISKALFMTYLSNVPFNIINATLLLLNQFPLEIKHFMFVSYIGQTVSAACLVIILAACNSSIYSCKKYFVSLQYGLGRYQLRDKIHHQRFYEQVHYKYYIGLGFGPLGVITKSKLFEVSSISGHILFLNFFSFSSFYFSILASYCIVAKL